MSFRFRCTLLASVAAAFALLPVRFLESGPRLCLFKLLTGHDCRGCGTLRALSCLLHLDPAKAWQHNHLIVVTAPLILLLSLRWLLGRDTPENRRISGPHPGR